MELEDRSLVNAISKKLWTSLDMLRGEISSDHYYGVLILMLLHKDGYFENRNYLFETSMIRFIEAQAKIEKNGTGWVRDAMDLFENDLVEISQGRFKSIIHSLDSLDYSALNGDFPKLFDNILFTLIQSKRYVSEFALPREIVRFACNLVELPNQANVFNPFAGIGSFGIELTEGNNYVGQEINSRTWLIGYLRLKAYEIKNSMYMPGDSVEDWEEALESLDFGKDKFDLVISCPPFAYRLPQPVMGKFGSIKRAEHLVIEKGLEDLNQSGKLVIVVTQSFLSQSGGERNLREYLVENGLLQMVISLPGGLLMHTGVSVSIIVINKERLTPGSVRFVDAKEFVKETSTREKTLNVDELLSFIRSNEESDFARNVSIEKFRENEYNLSVPRYLGRIFDGEPLSKVLQPLPGQKVGDGEIGKVVRMSVLKDDSLDYFLDAGKIEDSILNRPARKITESCLLVSSRWKTLKPTFFKFEGDPILISNDIDAFKIKVEDIYLPYLIHELHAEYVNEQLNSYRSVTAIPYLRREDLLKIKIVKPSLEEQQAKVEGYREVSSDIVLLRKKIEALEDGNRRDKFDEFASLKHTLGRPRQNILDWSDNLIHFLNSKAVDIVHLNKSFADFYDIDIISALFEIKRDINFMSEVLEKGEKGLVLSDYPKRLVTLTEMNGIVNGISSNGFNFKLVKIPIRGESLRNRGVECNSTLFKTLVDNILTNANKHGFSNKEVANEVVIKLSELEGYLLMDISNNGRQFPKNFDKDKFINKYSTANPKIGSGLGGYDINRIAEYFTNPKWELILGNDPIYPVQFRFQFPIKLAN